MGWAISLVYPGTEGGLIVAHGDYYLLSRRLQEGKEGDDSKELLKLYFLETKTKLNLYFFLRKAVCTYVEHTSYKIL